MKQTFWLITEPGQRTKHWRKKKPARKAFIREVNTKLHSLGYPTVNTLPAARAALMELQIQGIPGSHFKLSKLKLDDAGFAFVTEIAEDAFHSGVHYGVQNDDDSDGLLGWEDSNSYATLHD